MDLLWRRNRQRNWTTVGTGGGKMQKRQVSTVAFAVRNSWRNSSEYGECPENRDAFSERKWTEDTPEE